MKENGVKKRILMVDDEVGFTLSFGLEDNGFFVVDTYNHPLMAVLPQSKFL